MSVLKDRLEDPSLFRSECYVDGKWVEAASGKLFFVDNPSTAAIIGQCPEFDEADTDASILAAQRALPAFRHTPPRQRAQLLRRWHDLMLEHASDLALIITCENGKPLADAAAEQPGVPHRHPARLTALALAELARRAGVPPGVLNVVTACENTAAVGKVLTTHPVVKKVSFTGSTPVGKLLMRQASSTLKKLSFELGGNAPFIVFEDADLDAAIKGLVACKFRLSGQTCVCANRVLVHRAVYDRFLAMLVDVVETFRVGDGLDPSTTHGPLIHGRAVQKCEDHVRDAVGQGARLLTGGARLPLGGNYFGMTVLADMKSSMRIAQEETFGPIAAVFPFDTEEEAVKLSNDVHVGLAGYFFSKDHSRCWRVAEALEVGMVGVNTGAISDPVAPFGGVKESGFGREGSRYGIDEYLTTKMVMMAV
ncbi:Aldehyde/histidinol dehydrogenase [Beauveria brongniartii RCEF 3172]|uniref:Succinate-semialdehyde dehydrogenase, mitochondrial n=1 Tax=Beauveria brongniartii RCEF 3172 TaxID=1081107 RepID=A0A162J6P1_9HYPO|nr:Aldehyde/histidinol dehydrogenase [Beauveria brongniartii RCEF 3172]